MSMTIKKRPPMNFAKLKAAIMLDPSGRYLVDVHQYVVVNVQKVEKKNLLTTAKGSQVKKL